jgi:hypothetical protein
MLGLWVIAVNESGHILNPNGILGMDRRLVFRPKALLGNLLQEPVTIMLTLWLTLAKNTNAVVMVEGNMGSLHAIIIVTPQGMQSLMGILRKSPARRAGALVVNVELHGYTLADPDRIVYSSITSAIKFHIDLTLVVVTFLKKA